jgi:hypothetical protein
MPTRQEQELLNLLSGSGASGDFELTIKSKSGQWHLSFFAPQTTKRGIGETFAESWEDSKLEPNKLHIADIAEWARAKTELPSTGHPSSGPPKSNRPSDKRKIS